jgi:hypothetical protein
MKTFLILILSLVFALARAQDINPLFASAEPLQVKITGSIKNIKRNSNDSTFVTGKFMYQEKDGNWTTVKTDARTRGNFRLKNCYFPPVKLKLDKKSAATTVFAGNKALKLVLPCKTSRDKNELVRMEYLCYKFYEILAPFHFKTRLANITLTETSARKVREYDLLGFFVEDNNFVAKRGNAKVLEVKGLDPSLFDERNSVRNDFFQFMIGNADWSGIYQHNTNVLYAENKYVVLPYDFDMSGFVNAPYARENPPTLGTGDPRERVYRGFCKSKQVMQEVRKEFLEKELAIHELIDRQKEKFSKYQLQDLHGYIDSFFDILKDDGRFENVILGTCR